MAVQGKTLQLLGPHFPTFSSSPSIFPLQVLIPGRIKTGVLEKKAEEGKAKEYQTLNAESLSFHLFQRAAQLVTEVANTAFA